MKKNTEYITTNKKYILFGAGKYGKEALLYFGMDSVAFFMDNDIKKIGTNINGKEVMAFSDGILQDDKYIVCITVISWLIEKKLVKQLQKRGIKNYVLFRNIVEKHRREKILNRPDYIDFYKSAIKFIYDEIINNTSALEKEIDKENILTLYATSLKRFGYSIDKKSYDNNLKNGDLELIDLSDEKLICTTDIFKMAIKCFKIDNVDKGIFYFYKAIHLHMHKNIFYGIDIVNDPSYIYLNGDNKYLAMKYFLDALYYKGIAEFNMAAPNFQYSYDKNDGRYIFVENVIKEVIQYKKNVEIDKNIELKIADVGCGKGAYIRNLVDSFYNNIYYAIDISDKVMEYVDIENVIKAKGSLCHIPYENNYFDIVYACESMEHSIDIHSALKEMIRVTKSKGKVVIVDKTIRKYGALEIGKWEQWLDEEDILTELGKYCVDVRIDKNIDYGYPNEGLFVGIVGVKE